MLGEHAGSDLGFIAGIIGGANDFDGAEECFEILERESAGAKEAGLVGELKDGGFDSDRTRASIEDVINAVAELIGDMPGGGGTDASEEVGAGSGNGEIRQLKNLMHQGMSGHAQADVRESGSDEVGNGVFFGEDQGEGSGPEACGELFSEGRKFFSQGSSRSDIRDMDDQGIEFGTLLGGEDAGDGMRIEGVCSEAIDGLRREGDDSPIAQDPGGGFRTGSNGGRGGHGGRSKNAIAKKTGEPCRLPMKCVQPIRPMSFGNDIGEESHEASAEDGVAYGALILGAVAGPASRNHVAFAVDHDLEGAEVLVIDIDGARTSFGGAEAAAKLALDAGLLAFVWSLGLFAEPKGGRKFVHASGLPNVLITHTGQ